MKNFAGTSCVGNGAQNISEYPVTYPPNGNTRARQMLAVIVENFTRVAIKQIHEDEKMYTLKVVGEVDSNNHLCSR